MPPSVPADHEWSVVHQVVVPKLYRTDILQIAHATPLSGHLGVNKTYNKILCHFFWPGLKKSVVEFCKSCHTCQMVGKPNQIIPKAPLHPIPAIGEPFSRILNDCVGPLPKTKAGNQYTCILTIMCVATRFPETIPYLFSKLMVMTLLCNQTQTFLKFSITMKMLSTFVTQERNILLSSSKLRHCSCHHQNAVMDHTVKMNFAL